ncbi:Do family serine endopeptidase [Asticcacaulis machinosus]|uniref:Do family serine endopeptidase n=1 Tax=Asticcacaulis machinosus TaxID=2984211 RepID=A0ABT5HLZ4_9CAUL|nr:Do family serine endopeptidase [Asticcacaulis machinosus]MDC7677268.1 Do family serine endopeptidase [Asticcacaulis machinosus]
MGKLDLKSLLKNKTSLVGGIVGLALGATVAAGAMTGIANLDNLTGGYDGAKLIKTQDLTPVKPPAGAPMSFADIIDRVSPAVVSIETKGKVKVPQGMPMIPGFNFPGQPQPGQEAPEQEVRGAGSGFFISGDGYIVTNNHVIAEADEITVKLTNDQKLKATVVGRDPNTDLAVLKVEGKNFPFVNFELETKPRVGDWVIAVGNPFGFSGTATAGIVSAYGRDIGEQYVDYLQIDAPINRGNSGGPTFDLYGRVIGVNTAIITPSGASAGVGFAIPAEIAHSITQKLIKGGKIERGYIGVTVSGITEEIGESLGTTDLDGAFISDVTKGGPSDKAGVQPGDIVRAVNGEKIKSNTDLTRRVGAVRVGDKVTLDVIRSGKPIKLTITAALRPTDEELNKGLPGGSDPSSPDAPANAPGVLGLSLKPVSPETRKSYGIEEGVAGLVITSVTPDSDAGKKGVKPGMVVVRIDNRPVTTVADFNRIVDELKKAGRPSVLLMVNADGRNVPLPLSLK